MAAFSGNIDAIKAMTSDYFYSLYLVISINALAWADAMACESMQLE